MPEITHTVRNQSDDSVIAYCASADEAQRVSVEVVAGDFDGNPRECWICPEGA